MKPFAVSPASPNESLSVNNCKRSKYPLLSDLAHTMKLYVLILLLFVSADLFTYYCSVCTSYKVYSGNAYNHRGRKRSDSLSKCEVFVLPEIVI